MVPKVEDMKMAVIEQEYTFEGAIDGVNEMIDSTTDTAVVLLIHWCPGGERVVEQ